MVRSARREYEADVSAQQPPAEKNARFPQENEHAGRTGGPETAPQEGPETPGRLIPRCSFPPADRIRKRSEYQHVYRNGRKIVSRSFILFHLENGLGRPRLGITATRKMGPAVSRNRAKRLLREWFRTTKPELPSGDFVVNAREGMQRLGIEQLARELKTVMRRLSLEERRN
jgi:ribonuclease P protein component